MHFPSFLGLILVAVAAFPYIRESWHSTPESAHFKDLIWDVRVVLTSPHSHTAFEALHATLSHKIIVRGANLTDTKSPSSMVFSLSFVSDLVFEVYFVWSAYEILCFL